MKIARLIRVSMRACGLLLAILVGLCAAGLAGPAMVMADGQHCVETLCDMQIGCGQPVQPQDLSGSAIHLRATPASGGWLLLPARIVTRSVDLPPVKASWPTIGLLVSRAPPAI